MSDSLKMYLFGSFVLLRFVLDVDIVAWVEKVGRVVEWLSENSDNWLNALLSVNVNDATSASGFGLTKRLRD